MLGTFAGGFGAGEIDFGVDFGGPGEDQDLVVEDLDKTAVDGEGILKSGFVRDSPREYLLSAPDGAIGNSHGRKPVENVPRIAESRRDD